jgi:hypothetical protein
MTKIKKIVQDEVFSIPMFWNKGGNIQLDFYTCSTNELNPYREIKELGIVIFDKEKKDTNSFMQIDNKIDLGINEIENLIKFLNKVKRHIKEFNNNSKAKE